jgi:hypothetical protein
MGIRRKLESQTHVPASSSPLDLTAFEQRNAERRRLKEAATEGPWYAHNPDDTMAMNAYCVTTSPHEPDTEDGSGAGIVAATLLQSFVPVGHESGLWRADAAFIAYAKNDPVEADVDAMLAEVRRLQGLIAEADRRTGELWDDTGEDQGYG